MKGIFIFISCFFLICLAFMYEQAIMINIDMKTLLFFEKIRTDLLSDFFMFFTYMGSIKFLLPLCFIISLFLLIKRHYLEIFVLFFILFATRWINHIVKMVVKRERPALHPLIEIGEYSFPSGHAMNAIAVYGFLLFLIVYGIKVGRKYRIWWFIITTMFIIFIALSRMYLGVHYLTDIMAGLFGGLICLLCTIYLYDFLEKRKGRSGS